MLSTIVGLAVYAGLIMAFKGEAIAVGVNRGLERDGWAIKFLIGIAPLLALARLTRLAVERLRHRLG